MSIHSILSTSTAGLGMRYMLVHPLNQNCYLISSFLSIHVYVDFLRSDREVVHANPYILQVTCSLMLMTDPQDETCIDSVSRQHLKEDC